MPDTNEDDRQSLGQQVGVTKDLVEVELKKLLTLQPKETGAWARKNKDLLVRRSCSDNRLSS
jgi:hypothetical protein